MAKRKANLTQLEIIQTAIKMFLEKGYSATSARAITEKLKLSPGNVTYYYPTKEHMLAVLIELLADFQWKKARDVVNDGETPITALCFELTAMAAMCDENEIARDLYLSAYTSSRTLEIIRKNDAERAKKIFTELCSDWTDNMYAEAETLVSGIEYATLVKTSDSPPLEMRISGAMRLILGIYNVPEERIKIKTERALSLDYRLYGRQLFDNFKKYVFEITEKSFDDLVKNRHNSLLEKIQ